MAGKPFSPAETTFLRALLAQSADTTTSELARRFREQYPERTFNSVRCKIEDLRNAPPAKDESAEVQEWVRRREAAQREMEKVVEPLSAIRERLQSPPPLRNVGTSQQVPTELERVLIISDAHVPFHSRVWWSLMMQVARDLKPQHIVIIGDFADCYSVSDHDKDPSRANRMPEELAEVDKCLDELDALGATDKLYIEGNHEDRLRRLLMKVPQLAGLVSIPKLLRLEERGWHFVPYKRHARRGAIHYTHDVNAAGRNAVFRALDTYQHSVVTGHTHRFQYIVEGSAVGDCKISAMFGWGGDVELVDYTCLAKARKDWALGFGVGYHDPSTEYTYLVPVPIVHGSCCVEGRLYRAA